ncbi:phosphoribosylglycinamide formyltransferase [Candidatus Peregrinibacteria bacterium]|nr:phosphoribosylglycinamide formyltransferase [Candidatus Peregrinibacteria bacterium]
MYRIAIFASTRGTDFQAILDERRAGKIPGIEIACLMTNVKDCGAVAKAEAAQIPVHFIDPAGKTRGQFDQEAIKALEPYQIDLIFLLGYMRIIGPAMVQRYEGHILNVHPSLLPKFAGGMDTDVHQAVLDAKEQETGMTIHIVTNQLDAGKIVCQRKVRVAKTDTAETLKAKVQDLEKRWVPKVIKEFAARSK